MQRYHWAITLATTLLVVLAGLCAQGGPLWLIRLIFGLSPLAVVWMVYEILRHAPYRGRELQADEAFGYADRATPKRMM